MNTSTRAAHTPECRVRMHELIGMSTDGRARIDRATERATGDAPAPNLDARQGGEEAAREARDGLIPDSEETDGEGNVTKVTDNGRTISVYDKNGKLIKGRVIQDRLCQVDKNQSHLRQRRQSQSGRQTTREEYSESTEPDLLRRGQQKNRLTTQDSQEEKESRRS